MNRATSPGNLLISNEVNDNDGKTYESIIQWNEPFLFSGTVPAPVIGYHRKDKKTLERFDPLLQSTSVSTTGRTVSPSSSSVATVDDVAHTETPNSPLTILDEYTACTPPTMVMNTNFFESEYPDPVSVTSMKKLGSTSRRTNSRQKQRKENGTSSNESSPGLVWNRKKSFLSFSKNAGHEELEYSDPMGTTNQTVVKGKGTPTAGQQQWNRFNNAWKTSQRSKSESTVSERDDETTTRGGDKQIDNRDVVNDLYSIETGNVNLIESLLWVPTINATTEFVKARPTSFFTNGQYYMQRTSEQHPSEWQIELPSRNEIKTSVNICQFLESSVRTYKDDGEYSLFDMQKLVGHSRYELKHILTSSNNYSLNHMDTITGKRSIIEWLLQCGNEISSVKGYYSTGGSKAGSPKNNTDSKSGSKGGTSSPKNNTDSKLDNPNNREALILEGNRQFICAIRSTSSKRKNQYSKINQWETTQIDFKSNGSSDETDSSVKVFKDCYDELSELQTMIYPMLDKITDENPFYDVVFCGHAFGSALATLAAFKYAWTRPSLRVAAYCTNTSLAEVGMLDFRFACHSLPNLKIIRVEIGRCIFHNSENVSLGPCHVGHILHISQTAANVSTTSTSTTTMATETTEHDLNKDQPRVTAYKFSLHYPAHTRECQKPAQITKASSAQGLFRSNTKEECRKPAQITKASSAQGLFRSNTKECQKPAPITKSSSAQGLFRSKMNISRNRGMGTKCDASLKEYANILQQIGTKDCCWVERFSNENYGEGVIGSNDENRQLS